MNFRDYKTASKYAAQINAGYSACLFCHPRETNPHTDEGERAAWHYGWDEASKSGNVLLRDGA